MSWLRNIHFGPRACAGLLALACLTSVTSLISLTSFTSLAHAQTHGVDPGEVRPTPPAPRAWDEPEVLSLPPLELPSETEAVVDEADGHPTVVTLDARTRITIERFDFVGHSVFGEAELNAVVAPWKGRPIGSGDLLAARNAITDLYLSRGYATSGALLPDQDVSDGSITIRIVEGAVTEIEIDGHHRVREAYLRPRIERASRAPVQLGRLRRALEVLQRDRWIEKIDAHLEPGANTGEARLVVHVTEARQWQLGAEVANDKSPSVGSTGGIFDGTVANVLGMADTWSARFQITKGYRDVEARFEVPITRFDTAFRFRFRDTRSEIVEDPFDVLDIEATARTYAFSLFQPLLRTDRDELWFEFTADRSQTNSKILGLDFCFEVVATDCAEPVVSALRIALQWTRSTDRNAFSARSVFSFGIDALGASTSSVADTPDGQFFAWLGQAQWAHVLSDSLLGSTVLLRGDSQLANDPLLSIEKIAVGGRRTVRGYRENRLVRDNGVILSGEVRVPVWRTSLDRPILEIVPFMDWGYAWNNGIDPPTNQLWSIGAGLRFMPREGALAEFYWGGRIDDRTQRKSDAQDYGIHFRVRIDAPDIL